MVVCCVEREREAKTQKKEKDPTFSFFLLHIWPILFPPPTLCRKTYPLCQLHLLTWETSRRREQQLMNVFLPPGYPKWRRVHLVERFFSFSWMASGGRTGLSIDDARGHVSFSHPPNS